MRKAFGVLVVALAFVFGGSVARLSAEAAPVTQAKTSKKIVKHSKKASSAKNGTNTKSKGSKKARGKHVKKGIKKK